MLIKILSVIGTIFVLVTIIFIIVFIIALVRFTRREDEIWLEEQKEREKYTHSLEEKLQKCKEVFDKLYVMDYYWGDDALEDLRKIFEGEEK